jgi:hypothetical protein
LAVASLVLSIVWLGGLGSLLAVIFGFASHSQIKKSNGTKTGDGIATAGIAIGFVGLGGLALLIVLAAAANNAVNTLSNDLTPRTVTYRTPVNVSGGAVQGLTSVTVYSLTTPPKRTVSGASIGSSVVVARMRFCADSSGVQSGLNIAVPLVSVYFPDRQTVSADFGSISVKGAGNNLNNVNTLAAHQCVSGYLPFAVAGGTHPSGVEYAADVLKTIRWTG